MTRRALNITVALLALSQTVFGLSAFHIGNSFSNYSNQFEFTDYRFTHAGKTYTVKRHICPGSPLLYTYENGKDC
jgi:hypothetical protein